MCQEPKESTQGQQEPSNQTNAAPPPPPATVPQTGNPAAGQPATAQQLQQAEDDIENRMSAFERTTIRLTRAGVIIGVITLLIFAGQLYEMIEGGTATDKLVGYAQRQADDADKIKLSADKQAIASQQFADNAALINSGVGNAVKKLDAQAKATQGSANAAQSAAKTADKALHISERAYIVVGQPIIDTTTKYITLPIINTGHIPSGKVVGTVHEITIDGVDPKAGQVRVKATESHWKHYELVSVPTTGQIMNFNVPVPALNADNLNGGHQQIVVVGVISYGDGFSDDPAQQWTFCEGSAMLPQSKSLQWAICDPDQYMPEAIKEDHYPSNEYPN